MPETTPPPVVRNRRLATIAGIDIRFHSSWFIILVLIGLSLAQAFKVSDPRWGNVVIWVAAIVTTLLFFASVVIHEMAHSLVARAHGLPVHGITLFVFGGVSELTREPDDARTEFRIAIAGPASSVILGAICLGLARLGSIHQPVFAVLNWLGEINLILAIFNLIPGFPLDGGRVLRALLWSGSRDLRRATRIATWVGKAVAIGLIVYGVVTFFAGSGLGGIWMAFIGWFLLVAAEQSWRQTEMRGALDHFTVRDLASPFFSRAEPDTTLEEYFHGVSETHQYRASLVVDGDDHLLGVISPVDLARVPRADWAETRVRDLMIPRERVAGVAPGDNLAAVLQTMVQQQVGQLPVLEGGRVQGVIRRDRIMELLHSQLAPGK